MTGSLVTLSTVLALVGQPAAEPDLVRVTPHGASSEWSVDTRSIARAGNAATARIRIAQLDGARRGRFEDVTVSIDCRTFRMRPLSMTSYSPAGTAFARRPISEAEIPAAIAQPRTAAGAVASRICGTAGRFDYAINSAMQVN